VDVSSTWMDQIVASKTEDEIAKEAASVWQSGKCCSPCVNIVLPEIGNSINMIVMKSAVTLQRPLLAGLNSLIGSRGGEREGESCNC